MLITLVSTMAQSQKAKRDKRDKRDKKVYASVLDRLWMYGNSLRLGYICFARTNKSMFGQSYAHNLLCGLALGRKRRAYTGV